MVVVRNRKKYSPGTEPIWKTDFPVKTGHNAYGGNRMKLELVKSTLLRNMGG